MCTSSCETAILNLYLKKWGFFGTQGFKAILSLFFHADIMGHSGSRDWIRTKLFFTVAVSVFCCPSLPYIQGQFRHRVTSLGWVKSWVLPQKRKSYFNLVQYPDTTLLLKFRIMESFRFGKTSKLIKSNLPLNISLIQKWYLENEQPPKSRVSSAEICFVPHTWIFFCAFRTEEHAGTAPAPPAAEPAPWGCIFNAYPILPVPHRQVLKAATLSPLMATDISISWTSRPCTSYAPCMFATKIL